MGAPFDVCKPRRVRVAACRYAFCDEGLLALGAALSSGLALTSLSLVDCGVTVLAARAIAVALRTNRALRSLKFSGDRTLEVQEVCGRALRCGGAAELCAQPLTHARKQIRAAENLYYLDVPRANAEGDYPAEYTRDNEAVARTWLEEIGARVAAQDLEDVVVGNLLPVNAAASTLNGIDVREGEWSLACAVLRPYEVRWIASRLTASPLVFRLRCAPRCPLSPHHSRTPGRVQPRRVHALGGARPGARGGPAPERDAARAVAAGARISICIPI